jgi:hypothetical protein
MHALAWAGIHVNVHVGIGMSLVQLFTFVQTSV